MAGISALGTSLNSASSTLHPSLLTSGSLALVDPLRSIDHAAKLRAPSFAANGHRNIAAIAELSAPLPQGCQTRCERLASINDGKSQRLVRAPATPSLAAVAPTDRFEKIVAAELSPEILAAAFARAGIQKKGHAAGIEIASVEPIPAPAQERFAATAEAPLTLIAPTSPRFGADTAETEKASRLAVALAAFAPNDNADASPAEVIASALNSSVDDQTESDPSKVSAALLSENAPDSIPLPTRRPPSKNEPARDAASPTAPAKDRPTRSAALPAESAKPALSVDPAKRSSRATGDMLAYARPDDPEGGVAGAFKNLFTSPGRNSGVAIYDISARTVYLPDGQRLEAHSGLGRMVDKPRFVHEKDRGPTPPNTYDLVLRESRFHGVEAIRLIPTDRKNKYGRDGLLAHTYMLRGGRAESNGCVVFKEYARFLAAFKKGKIRRLVVVPGSSQPGTRFASNGRGA